MLFDLRNEYKLQEFKDKVNELYKQRAVVELTKVSPNRSLSQNNYLHLLLGFFGLKTGYTTQEVKDGIFKTMVNVDIFKSEFVCKETGEVITRWRSTSELNSAEMTLAIQRFRNWSSAEVGLYLPEPNEKGFLLDIRSQVEKAAEYICITD